MNQHATPKDADPSESPQSFSEDEDIHGACRKAVSTAETEEILRRLDEIHYHPRKEALKKILKYAKIPPKCPH